MTEQIKKDHRGFLHPNGNKTKPTQPDYTGNIMIEGKEWRLAAWENKNSEGKAYLSIISSPPLSPEQQNQFKQNKDNANNSSNSESGAANSAETKQNNYYNQSQDLDDLDDILKNADDDNPFN